MNIIDNLSDDEIECIEENAELIEYEKDCVFIKQGDDARHLYFIVEGEVEIYIEENNKKLSISKLGEGEVVGEMALIAPEPRSASVVALSPVSVYGIAINEMQTAKNLAPIYIKLILSICKSLSARLRSANNLCMEAIIDGKD